jgi:hypothetical protein
MCAIQPQDGHQQVSTGTVPMSAGSRRVDRQQRVVRSRIRLMRFVRRSAGPGQAVCRWISASHSADAIVYSRGIPPVCRKTVG